MKKLYSEPWFVVATLVVAFFVGSFLADVTYSWWLMHSLETQVQEMQERSARQLNAAKERQRKQAVRQRFVSARGQELRETCNRWKGHLERIQTNTVRERMQRHCWSYQRYVLYGE